MKMPAKMKREMIGRLSRALVEMMRSENEDDPKRQVIIEMLYKEHSKEDVDELLSLARLEAAEKERSEKIPEGASIQ